MNIEPKRATELVLCDLLKEELPDFAFFPSRGGGNETTPDWEPNHAYLVGDTIRPTDHGLLNAVVVTTEGTSDASEPAFDDVVDATYSSTEVEYRTINEEAVVVPVDAAGVEPPVGVVTITKASLIADDTWAMEGEVEWITSIDRETVSASSQDAQKVLAALNGIDRGYDEYRHIMVHGFNVTGTEESSDEEHQGRSDKFMFVLGITASRFIPA